MPPKTRAIVIELTTRDLKKGKISVSLLSSTLQGIQHLAYQLGNSRIEREPSLPGRFPSMIKRELELFFIKAKPGSLIAEVEFSEKESTLFPDFPDFTEKIIEDMHNVVSGIKNDETDTIQKCIPNPDYRKRILSEFVPVIPQKKTDYEISFRFGNFNSIDKVVRPQEEQVQRYIGTLIEKKKEKPAEAIIQARCRAKLGENGKLEKILDVLNYELFEEMDLRPYRVSEIHWQNRKFVLNREIACDVRKEESIIIMEFEDLKIRTSSFSRTEAINDFSEEFAFIWDTYASEHDKNLTKDAMELKNAIRSLIMRVDRQ